LCRAFGQTVFEIVQHLVGDFLGDLRDRIAGDRPQIPDQSPECVADQVGKRLL
jgi:hypothetical protein